MADDDCPGCRLQREISRAMRAAGLIVEDGSTSHPMPSCGCALPTDVVRLTPEATRRYQQYLAAIELGALRANARRS